MVLGTVTSMYAQSKTGFGFDVTNVYSYDESVTGDVAIYKSSYTFDMSDSIFIHKVVDQNLIQIYRIVDYEYERNTIDGIESHTFVVQSIGSGNLYYYGVIYYIEDDLSILVLGDDDTFSSGILMEVDKVYKVNQ